MQLHIILRKTIFAKWNVSTPWQIVLVLISLLLSGHLLQLLLFSPSYSKCIDSYFVVTGFFAIHLFFDELRTKAAFGN